MYHFANLNEAALALEAYYPSRLKRFAYTTEHIERFMDFVHNPQNKPRSIHIAGTSGKTSTAYYTASLLQQKGYKVGLLTSPHIESLNERVQIGLQPLDEKVFCSELALFMELADKSGVQLTYAEILYGFAFWEFARQHVDYIVVEVGMGGLLDATNCITREDKVCIITDIGLDHTNVLGGSVTDIAQHKAGIIQLHNKVFCYAQQQEIMEVIQDQCHKVHADLTTLTDYGHTADISFLPKFQRRNFRLAYETVQTVLGYSGQPAFTAQQLTKAAKQYIPGRMEIHKYHNQTLVLDAAHNPQKVKMLRESITEYAPGQTVAALIALSASGGRQPADILAELAPFVSHVIVTGLAAGGYPKSYGPQVIAEACQAVGIQSVEVMTNQEQACKALLQRPEPILLVTGSLYLIAQIKPLLSGSAVRP